MDLTVQKAINTGADVYLSVIKGQLSKKNPNSGRINIFFYNQAGKAMADERYSLEISTDKLYFIPEDVKGTKAYRLPNDRVRLDYVVKDKNVFNRFRGIYSKLCYDEALGCHYIDISNNISFDCGSHAYYGRVTTKKRKENKKMGWAEDAMKLGYDKPEVCKKVVEEAKEERHDILVNAESVKPEEKTGRYTYESRNDISQEVNTNSSVSANVNDIIVIKSLANTFETVMAKDPIAGKAIWDTLKVYIDKL